MFILKNSNQNDCMDYQNMQIEYLIKAQFILLKEQKQQLLSLSI